MNKDIDNINNTDESVEKALDIMESSSEINDEQLQEMLKDKEVLRRKCPGLKRATETKEPKGW